MKKRTLAAILCLVVLLGVVQPLAVATDSRAEANTAGGGENQTRWTNTQSITLAMSYSGGKLNWTGQIQGNASTIRITATYKLEKKVNNVWTAVDSWPGLSTTSTYMNSSGSSTTSTGTYKLTVTGTVTSNTGYVEAISSSLEKTFT